jgi:hypothetical protein
VSRAFDDTGAPEPAAWDGCQLASRAWSERRSDDLEDGQDRLQIPRAKASTGSMQVAAIAILRVSINSNRIAEFELTADPEELDQIILAIPESISW